ncbi:HesA/MoeB/ThiF family protein [Halococcoides cellulosivorans]|uniref:Adenylyltransferase n=1 Tax=Halococcoides cellulosivorans TaxID=1679096 RepID=A0A2R4X180_9EURY|nr:molybdopterin-synthase adenylyltransferase MoeB [Halococcoides cellulosivorans]AWB27541.1 adenylyltransferase [Halococcoides cellulosivorans]
MSGLDLDAAALDRYSRQIIMDEIGVEGQAALCEASVLVVGAGGLGSPAIAYLAGAGVGRLGIVDDDVVERSNLHRQVIHTEADLDRPKVESARAFVAARAPEVTVETHETRLDRDAVAALVAEYDLVVDGSDNFATRFLLNDACTLADTPVSHGAVYRFEGQVTTVDGGAPCYRCLFEEAPPADAVPDCATAGVLGVLPGTIGTIQATEAIKLLLDYGESLAGRMIAYDAERLSFDEIPFAPNPDCPVCGADAVDSLDEISYTDRYGIETTDTPC